MLRAIYNFVFHKLIGWKIVGRFDPALKKFIIIVAPHTSNWDFVIGVMARSILKLTQGSFLGKSQLFKWPHGFIFKALGGYPVDRTKHNNWVEAAVELYNSKDEFVMALAPEGTRRKVDRIKTGFYHIAEQAKIPIYMVGFDYAKKTIFIEEPFHPTGDKEADLQKIMAYFKTISGRHPEQGL